MKNSFSTLPLKTTLWLFPKFPPIADCVCKSLWFTFINDTLYNMIKNKYLLSILVCCNDKQLILYFWPLECLNLFQLWILEQYYYINNNFELVFIAKAHAWVQCTNWSCTSPILTSLTDPSAYARDSFLVFLS